jgi:hypothetical protein
MALPNFGNLSNPYGPMAALVIFRFAQEGLELLLPYIGQRIAVLEEGVGAAACCLQPQE